MTCIKPSRRNNFALLPCCEVKSLEAAASGGGWLVDLYQRAVICVIVIGIPVGAVGALARVGAMPSRWGACTDAVMLGVGYSATAAVPAARRGTEALRQKRSV